MFNKGTIFGLFLSLMVSGSAVADVIDGEELVDPTRPLTMPSGNDSSLVDELIRNVVPSSYDVSFIRAGNNSPIAVINGQTLTIGDVIGGAEVKAIDRSGVTLLVGEAERRISLYAVDVKSTPISQ